MLPATLSEHDALGEFEHAASILQSYPGGFQGKGIVIPGGGEKYFPSAWICIRTLRDRGCTLPIELWHLGAIELTESMRKLVEPLGVTCLDALLLSNAALGGWQLKPFSILNSKFHEVIFLDADNFPLVDPSYLFNSPPYLEHGAIFWPDLGCLSADHDIWRLTAVPFRDEPEFETGQIVIDKERCWQPLCLTMWMNRHSDFWYRYIYGDKDTFHLAWLKLDRKYAMPPHGPVALAWALCQHDFAGDRIFQHRNGAKWTLSGHNPHISGFIEEDRGLAYLEELRVKWALPIATESASIGPLSVDAALAHYRGGRLHEAEKVCRQLLDRHPGQASAVHLLGMIASKTGHTRDAMNLLRLSMVLAPDSAEFQNNISAVLGDLGRHDEALAAARRALELNPSLADAHNNVGVALEHLEQFEPATAAYRHAIKLNSSYAPAYLHLSNALRKLQRYDQAIEAGRKAVELLPQSADAHNGLGVALLERQDIPAALVEFRRAIELQPDHIDAHVNRGMALLLSGDLKAGWPEYEWRRYRKDPLWQRFATPPWNGADLSSRTILVYTEGGLGNAIQFARFVPFLARRGARILLECQAQLKPLLQTLEGVEHVLGRGEPLPRYDEHAALVSVPATLRMALDEIPCDIPYVRADPQRVRRWQNFLGTPQTLRVGINWLADQNTAYGRYRSVPLDSFGALSSIPDVDLISLQKLPPAEAPTFALRSLPDLDEEGGAFADTAAVMMSLDLVITCDTSIAHVAGALGRSVWIILPASPDWRWLQNRSDSPWYPTARLFRQTNANCWDAVFSEIATELAKYPRPYTTGAGVRKSRTRARRG